MGDNGKQPNSNIVGAVMVVGGGVSGMQTSLDLANSGYKVYLVDQRPSIGGKMAQLDKTFPTNDCAMCIISPKLNEVDKHLNIDIITMASVDKLEGEAGNFKVTLVKEPRYVLEDKCTACGECTKVCPIDLPNAFNEGLNQHKAIFTYFPQAVPNKALIDKQDNPPCRVACPANVNACGYVAMISQGKYKEALEVVRRTMPFAGVCGRVCNHYCEAECERRTVDEAISIRSLKRFVADYELKEGREKVTPIELTKAEKVAVIGSGPAGLACAYDLVREGYPVTVFEALPMAGGLLRYGIPAYRLPKDILDSEIEYVKDLGVEIKVNTSVKDIKQVFDQGYKAVFLGAGASISQKMGIPGEESEGVLHALDFLRQVNSGDKVSLGERVAVVGGGNAAVDAARTALRLGVKEVTIVYRRSRAEMPAADEEVHETEVEGVKFEFLSAPVKVHEQGGRLSKVECIRMKLGEPDASGRQRPEPVKGSEYTIDVDNLIIAIGQAVDKAVLSEELSYTNRGTLAIDAVTRETNIAGVFAGGDVVTGPKDVIWAVSAGKEAAESIKRYLSGTDIREGRPTELKRVEDVSKEGVQRKSRASMPMLDVKAREGSFVEVELGFDENAAIEEAKRCLSCSACCDCQECVKACQAKAIDHGMKGEVVQIDVGSIVLAPGYEVFDARLKGEYSYGRAENVVTSLEFERILSAAGPYAGEVLRPSDKGHPKKIAWIQCVGSRDTACGNEYCSSVCCMYALKQMVIAKEHMGEIDATIFYNDIRAFGKGFEQYYEAVKKTEGIRFIKSLVSSVKELQQSNNLLLTYTVDRNEVREEEFDMVVLSVGFQPSPSNADLAEKVGIDLDKYGFCQTKIFSPCETSRDGIYACGAFQGPMDIPESVVTSSGAAALSGQLLHSQRNTLVTEKEYPPEKDISNEEPKIGVFICHCGTNIARIVDVPEDVKYASTLPHVVHAENNLFTCSSDATKHIVEVIKEKDLNRVIVASCTPRTHEPLFREVIREAGLNPFLFEMANIRDQCSWVHMDEPEKATQKSKDLIRMAVARAATLKPLYKSALELNHDALVIGGGIAGMTTALCLANQGFKTYLVEREKELGGYVKNIHVPLDGADPQKLIQSLIEQVNNNQLIEVLMDTVVNKTEGFVGNFKTTLAYDGGEKQRLVEHGVIIVATGAKEYRGDDFLLGQTERALTISDLEAKIVNSPGEIAKAKDIAMLLCARPEGGDYQYCSRVCCTTAIKNAIKIKEINPEANIYIMYKDIRTYGFKEELYNKARRMGILFLRYTDEKQPELSLSGDKIKVDIFDCVLGGQVSLSPDLLVTATPMVPSEYNEELGSILKVPLTKEHFFHEAHVKLAPNDFASEGIFMCGTAHAPKFIDEAITQAQAAAGRAATVLSKEHLEVGGAVAVVDRDKCVACLTCVRVCPYGVPYIDKEGIATIEAAMCRGCGVCAAECPDKAIELQHNSMDQILPKIEALLV